MTPVEERRLKLIKRLAQLGQSDPHGWIASTAAILGTLAATLSRDLQGLAAGEIPGMDQGQAPPSAEQLAFADQLEAKTKTADEIDKAMSLSAALVMRRKITTNEAKTAHMILMGRRYFFATIEAAKAAKKAGATITAMAAPPLAIMGDA